MENKQKIFFGVLGVVVLALILVAVFVKEGEQGPGKYDQFAQCLGEKGATFYGAFWCPHCNDQKNIFGSSKKYLPYVECSLPNGNGQTQICIDKGIQGYPTWEFADGSRPFSGEVSLEDLSAQTGCVLPTDNDGEASVLLDEGGETQVSPEITETE